MRLKQPCPSKRWLIDSSNSLVQQHLHATACPPRVKVGVGTYMNNIATGTAESPLPVSMSPVPAERSLENPTSLWFGFYKGRKSKTWNVTLLGYVE